MAALEHPPERGRALRPWLARVLRNFARKQHRGEARRRAREADAVAPGALPTPSASLLRVSLQNDVVQAVLRLEEPYRETILWHYFEEIPAAEIARQRGVAPATVRQRLKRARDELARDARRALRRAPRGLVQRARRPGRTAP